MRRAFVVFGVAAVLACGGGGFGGRDSGAAGTGIECDHDFVAGG